MNFLYTAYAAVWIIHLSYLGVLVKRYSRVKRQMDDLQRK